MSDLWLLSPTDQGAQHHQRHGRPHTGQRWEGCENVNCLNSTVFSLCSLKTTLGAKGDAPASSVVCILILQVQGERVCFFFCSDLADFL